MFKAIKAPLIPGVIMLGNIVLAGSTEQQWLTGFVFGLALFWLAGTVIFNRNLIRRFPWIREWLPFLDPTGTGAVASELSHRHIEGKTFRLIDIAQNSVVVGRTFDDCVILGPAVFSAQGATVLREPHFHASHGDILYDLGDMKTRTGMIILRDCTLNRCIFYDIGVAQPKEFMKDIKIVGNLPEPIDPPDTPDTEPHNT